MSTFDVRTIDDIAVVELSGEIDISNVADLGIALVEAEAQDTPQLAIDLSGTTFLDSSGATAITRSYKRMKANEREVLLVCPEANVEVRRILTLMGLIDIMPLYESVAVARQS